MIRDFQRFFRHFFGTLYFVRGALLAFLLLLLACAIVVAIAEGMSFGNATYFVLVTALTVGYGDIVPTTMWGRIASLAAGVIGLLAFGIIVAVNTRALKEFVEENIREHNTKG
jgi:voltage-gated potassium channel